MPVNTDIEFYIGQVVPLEAGQQTYKPGELGKQDKEVCNLYSIHLKISTWTAHGWTILKCVIRHKLAKHKKMIRVITGAGCVDVTDDHSLLLKDGTEISPADCSIGQELLHKPLPICINPLDISIFNLLSVGFGSLFMLLVRF